MASSFGGTIKLQGESEYRKALKDITSNLRLMSSELKLTNTEFANGDKSVKQTKTSYDNMNRTVQDQKSKVNELRETLKKMEQQYGSNDEKVKTFKTQLNNAENQLKQMESATDKSTKELKEMGTGFNDAGNSALKFGDILKANILSDAIVGGVKALGSAIKSVGSAFLDVGKQALDSYANYEQLVGGVDTLFKENSKKVQDYANNAFKNSGLSANEYMETVTSFSASLLQSLNGDTAKSADVADMAITDMSDNANKMGTSMESIQNAYQGFAKQNYTMLDNLKLGYGGTKGEMERLLEDATKISGVEYDISNLNDVYQAIHIIQGELGITETTAKEASSTISGSVSSMKSAWKNMLTGIADDNANFEELVGNLVDSIVGEDGEGGVLSNLLPRIETVLDGLVTLIVELSDTLLPKIMDLGINLINNLVTSISENLPALLESANTILTTLINGIITALPQLVPMVMQIITTLVTSIIGMLPQILQAGIEILVSLVQGIAQSLPTLIPTIIDAVLLMVETLLDNIDLIIDAGIQLIIGLADGLINALPSLIDKIPVIIDKLVMAISNNLPKLVQAGITIMIKLIEGVVKSIPQLISKIPEIMTSFVNGFTNYYSQLWDVGKNLISGLWEGIKSKWEGLKDSVKNFGSGVVNKFKSVFGIHSPSRVFKKEIGTNLALGIEEGFSDTMSSVSQNMANAIPTEFDTSINASYGSNVSSSAFSYENIVGAFKQALSEMKIELDDEVAGKFVENTVTNLVYT